MKRKRFLGILIVGIGLVLMMAGTGESRTITGKVISSFPKLTASAVATNGAAVSAPVKVIKKSGKKFIGQFNMDVPTGRKVMIVINRVGANGTLKAKTVVRFAKGPGGKGGRTAQFKVTAPPVVAAAVEGRRVPINLGNITVGKSMAASSKNPLAQVDTDHDGSSDFKDTDDDGDGVGDSQDKDDEGNRTADAKEDMDTDDDGSPDCVDVDDDDDGINDSKDSDDDDDGVPDWDGDTDSDDDSVADSVDPDDDNDGVGDNPDNDQDGDGLVDSTEQDSDADGVPDDCDSDDDDDGIPDSRDDDNDDDGTSDQDEADTDGDGVPDDCDEDDDDDGIPDPIDD